MGLHCLLRPVCLSVSKMYRNRRELSVWSHSLIALYLKWCYIALQPDPQNTDISYLMLSTLGKNFGR